MRTTGQRSPFQSQGLTGGGGGLPGGPVEIADPSCVKSYGQRQATQWEHAAEIPSEFGYRDVTDAAGDVAEFLSARAWARPSPPPAPAMIVTRPSKDIPVILASLSRQCACAR